MSVSPVGEPPTHGMRGRVAAGLRQALMTAAAAWISYESTKRVGLREGYWSAISAIVVMQANLDDTRHSARDRFIGTAIGGVIAWICAAVWHGHVWIYALAVAVTVFACWVANVSNAGRLAAVAVTVIVLIPRDEAIWQIALFRFLEVSWGIAVAVGIVYFEAWAARECSMSLADELSKLSQLRADGGLNEEEFQRAKQRILNAESPRSDDPLVSTVNGFRRSLTDRWLGGVCGGMARATGMASWVWRLLFAVLFIFAGAGLLVYLLLWIFVPVE